MATSSRVSAPRCRRGRTAGQEAESRLRSAVAHERAARWPQAVEDYTALLRLLKEAFPHSAEPAAAYSQLLFETYYHLAVALQKQHRHKEAVDELTKAIEISSIPKRVCQVGCVSTSILQTPALCRRAYAHVKCENWKKAIDDANKVVELDPANPDIYCIRALVWSSVGQKKRAMVDLNHSLKLNPSHVCALIIRGAITNHLTAKGIQQPLEKNKDHEKAFELSKKNEQFFDVEDFSSLKMSDFYDKYLWSLSVSHTIMGTSFLSRCSLDSQSSSFPLRKELATASLPHQRVQSCSLSSPARYPKSTAFLRRASDPETVKELGATSEVRRSQSQRTRKPTKPKPRSKVSFLK